MLFPLNGYTSVTFVKNDTLSKITKNKATRNTSFPCDMFLNFSPNLKKMDFIKSK